MKPNRIFRLFIIAFIFGIGVISMAAADQAKQDKSIDRIDAKETRQKVLAGEALLVCSYDDESCKNKMLEGAIFRSEFEEKLIGLSKDQEVIFYCV